MILFVFLLIGSTLGTASWKSGNETAITKGKHTHTHLTVFDVYDNVEFDSNYKTGFGFGCVVKLKDKNILFDTGGDSPTLLSNMKTAGIMPEDIDIVFLSHIHPDHTGGLLGFLERNSHVKVYIPNSFPRNIKRRVASTGAVTVEIGNATTIAEGIYSTGELGGRPKETSLVVDSDKGLIVITGCAHPDIVKILKKVKYLFAKKIYLVIGGFHHPPATAVDQFEKLGVVKVAPSHCTGRPAIKAFEKTYQDNFIRSGVGKTIEISDSSSSGAGMKDTLITSRRIEQIPKSYIHEMTRLSKEIEDDKTQSRASSCGSEKGIR